MARHTGGGSGAALPPPHKRDTARQGRRQRRRRAGGGGEGTPAAPAARSAVRPRRGGLAVKPLAAAAAAAVPVARRIAWQRRRSPAWPAPRAAQQGRGRGSTEPDQDTPLFFRGQTGAAACNVATRGWGGGLARACWTDARNGTAVLLARAWCKGHLVIGAKLHAKEVEFTPKPVIPLKDPTKHSQKYEGSPRGEGPTSLRARPLRMHPRIRRWSPPFPAVCL